MMICFQSIINNINLMCIYRLYLTYLKNSSVVDLLLIKI